MSWTQLIWRIPFLPKKTRLNLEFSFSLTGCHTMVKDFRFPNHLSIPGKNSWIHAFPCDLNSFTTTITATLQAAIYIYIYGGYTSMYVYMYVHMWVCICTCVCYCVSMYSLNGLSPVLISSHLSQNPNQRLQTRKPSLSMSLGNSVCHWTETHTSRAWRNERRCQKPHKSRK